MTKFPSLDNVAEIDKVSYDVRVPDYMKNLAEEPTEEQIEHVKAKIVDEFRDVFSDGGAVLKPMGCEPSEIDDVAEAVPIRVSTARKLAYALREETKKELDLMVQQGVIKPVGDVASTWCHPMVCVEKPHGVFRIGVDLTKLDECLTRPI